MSLITLNGATPDHLTGRRPTGSLAAARSGVQASFAVIKTLGKTWKTRYRGEETLIRDERGQPRQELDVVIVGASPSISKNFYLKGYSQGDDAAPDCFSVDGLTPDPTSPHKQANVCATCPQNAWGSAQTTPNGKKAKACRDQRMVAVVPLGDIANEAMGGPMLLRLAPTSLVSFARYADYLERKGVGDMSWVGTKLTFDHEVSYPKIEFTAISYVTEEQDAQIAAVMKSPTIERMLYNFSPTESAEPEIPGKPPSRTNNVTALPRQQAAPPQPPPEEEGEDAPDEPEEEAPPPPPPAAQRATPFQQATTKRAPGRVSTQTTPALAPSDLEGAIDDLLDQPS
jgi:hypothetical protein